MKKFRTKIPDFGTFLYGFRHVHADFAEKGRACPGCELPGEFPPHGAHPGVDDHGDGLLIKKFSHAEAITMPSCNLGIKYNLL